jgi:hypothetical protein
VITPTEGQGKKAVAHGTPRVSKVERIRTYTEVMRMASKTEPCDATAPPSWRPQRDVALPISVALNAHASFRFKLSVVGKVLRG